MGRKFHRCSGCLLVQYCSDTCQKRHWKEQHRKLCTRQKVSTLSMCLPCSITNKELTEHTISDPVSLSGPDLRHVNRVVTYDCMMLDAKQHRLFKDYALNLQTARKTILLLDYDRPAFTRLQTKVINIEDPNHIAHLSRVAPCLQLTETWRASWSSTPLAPSASLQYVIPILVLLPRVLRDPQAMTALCTLHRPLSSPSGKKSPMNVPHIKWLHRT